MTDPSIRFAAARGAYLLCVEPDGDDLERLSLLRDLERELAGKDPRHGRVLDAVRGLLDDAERDAPTTRSQDGPPDRAGRRPSRGNP